MKGWSFSALTKAIKALAFWDAIDVYKAIYPVGICVVFADTTNPNTAFPGTTWMQITDAATIRAVGNASIGNTSGADDVTLTVNQLPSHSHSWSGSVADTDLGNRETWDTDLGTKYTEYAGQHSHQGGMAGPGAAWDSNYIVGSDNDSRRNRNYTTDNGNHQHPIVLGTHRHTFSLGLHAHGVTGSNQNTGGGQSFSVTGKVRGYGVWRRSA
ncbi:tail collar fiber protein [Erwinia phage Faunus]|uniref:Putative structural protein n=1 Tax=Erwinia phage Faunus TaxID=2182346 RepID=A0A2U8UWL5_9CAUD|nr:tail collar fiber protein [Erwinia phage Faunus]AWN08656.1 putative structural protein [Erwinia phage Faunus]